MILQKKFVFFDNNDFDTKQYGNSLNDRLLILLGIGTCFILVYLVSNLT